MPNVTLTPIRAFLYCPTSSCPGYQLEPVDGFEEETSWFFTENGGDLPNAVERSHKRLKLQEDIEAEQAEPGKRREGLQQKAAEARACEHCGRRRELTDRERPVYQPLAPDPDANPTRDSEVAELKAQVALLTQALTGGGSKDSG